MFRNALTSVGALLVAGAVTLWSAGTTEAAGHGGGHGGGGGHFGGGRGFSGAHFGGGRGFSGGHFGGFHNFGGFHSRPAVGYHSYYNHAWRGYGYGYRPYYSSYWYNPGLYTGYPYYGWPYYQYSGYGYSPYYNDYTSSDTTVPTDPGISGYSGLVGTDPGSEANYPAPTSSSTAAPEDIKAHVTATVPPGAELWFDGTKTESTGPERVFQTPPLTPGHKYSYEVRARWQENGREVTQTQKVPVTAGAEIHLTFPLPKEQSGSARK